MHRSVGDTAKGRADIPVGGAYANNAKTSTYDLSGFSGKHIRRTVATSSTPTTTTGTRPQTAQFNISNKKNASTDVPIDEQLANKIESNHELEHEFHADTLFYNLESMNLKTHDRNYIETNQYFHNRMPKRQISTLMNKTTAQVHASSEEVVTLAMQNNAVSIAGEGEYTIVDIDDGDSKNDDNIEPVALQSSSLNNLSKRESSGRLNVSAISQKALSHLSKDQERAVALEQMAYLKATVDQRRNRNKHLSKQESAKIKPLISQPAHQKLKHKEVTEERTQKTTAAKTKISVIVPTPTTATVMNNCMVSPTSGTDGNDNISGQRTRFIKRKIIWDPDAPETTHSSSISQQKLLRTNVHVGAPIITTAASQTSAAGHLQQHLLRRNVLGTGSDGSSVPITRYVLRMQQTGVTPNTTYQEYKDELAAGFCNGRDVSVGPSNKKKKINEVQRLMNDEGAANMVYEVQNSQRFRYPIKKDEMLTTTSNVNGCNTVVGDNDKESQKINPNNDNFIYVDVRAQNDEASETASGSLSLPSQPNNGHQPVKSWNYLYGDKDSCCMIVRRHSTSSFSSNGSISPFSSSKQQTANEAKPRTRSHDENSTNQLASVENNTQDSHVKNTSEGRAPTDNVSASSHSQNRSGIIRTTHTSDGIDRPSYDFLRNVRSENRLKEAKTSSVSRHLTPSNAKILTQNKKEDAVQEQSDTRVGKKHQHEVKQQLQKLHRKIRTEIAAENLFTMTNEGKQFKSTNVNVAVSENAASLRLESYDVEQHEQLPLIGDAIEKPKVVECDKEFLEVLDRKWNEMFKDQKLKLFEPILPENWLNIDSQWQEMGDQEAKNCIPKILLRQYGNCYCICLSHIISQRQIYKNCTLNAISIDVFAKTVNDCIQKEDCESIVVFSKNGSFCRGVNYGEFIHGSTEDREINAKKMGVAVKKLLISLATCPKPLIAATRGYNRGLGVSMLALFDYVIATPSTRFDTLYHQIGQLPEGHCFWNNIRNVNLSLKKKLLWAGEICSAPTCFKLGLVTNLVSAERLSTAVFEVAHLAGNITKKNLAYMKTLNIVENRITISEKLNAEMDLIIRQWSSRDVLKNILSLIRTNYRSFSTL